MSSSFVGGASASAPGTEPGVGVVAPHSFGRMAHLRAPGA